MGIQINLTGIVMVRGEDGRELHLASPRVQVALARMVLDRDVGITRDQLADTVWPDRLPATWCSALRTLVSRVRALLMVALPSSGDPVVALSGRYVLRLPDDAGVDVEQAQSWVWSARDALAEGDFGRARQLASDGVERLQSPFLPEHAGPWVDTTREQLLELLASGLETASQACAALEQPLVAVSLANQAVNRVPLRESAHRCLMAAHAAGGNRAEALRAYQRLRRVLMEELGVSPSDETEAAYLELLGPPSTPSRSVPLAARGQPAPAPATDRGRGLDVLMAAWGSAMARSRQVALVTGERGGPRSWLVVEMARQAAYRDGLVLFGRCDRDAAVPFRPFIEALDGYVAALPDDEVPFRRDGESEVPEAFPSLGSLARSGPLVEGGVERARLFDTIADVIVGATRDRPVLAILEDLQWADPDTLSLLHHVVRRSDGARLLLVAVMREGGVGHRCPVEVIRALGSGGHLHVAEDTTADPQSEVCSEEQYETVA